MKRWWRLIWGPLVNEILFPLSIGWGVGEKFGWWWGLTVAIILSDFYTMKNKIARFSETQTTVINQQVTKLTEEDVRRIIERDSFRRGRR